MEYLERTDSVTVPKNAGVPGLLKFLGALLHEIPRVKEVVIKHTGQVEYTWYVPKDGSGTKTLEVQFESLKPYAIIRNASIQEVAAPDPVRAVPALFNACQNDRLYPICLVTGADTHLWRWAAAVYGTPDVQAETFFGYPVIQDREVPDDVLILCASYARTQHITDTYRSYKVTLEASHNGK